LNLAGYSATATGTFTVASGATLRLQGGETLSVPTLSSGSTVDYNGSGTYTIKDYPYSNLTFSGSGTYNLPATGGGAAGYWKMEDINPNDDFASTINTSRWTPGGTASIVSGRLKLQGGTALGGSANVASTWRLKGDFDLQVDYDASSQPVPSSGNIQTVLVVRGTISNYYVIQQKYPAGTHDYTAWTTQTNGSFGTSSVNQSSGKFRLARSGSNITAYFWGGSSWTTLGSITNADTTDMEILNYTYNNAALSSTSIAYFDNFTVNSGQRIIDSSINSNSGSNQGATVSTDVPATIKFTNTQSLSFDGVNDYVSLTDSSTLSPSSQITMSAWVKPTEITGERRDIIYGSLGYFMGINANGKATSYIHNGVWKQAEQTTGTTPQLNQWSLITATYDGSTLRTYVNGVSVGSSAVSGQISNPTRITIGQVFNGGGTERFKGLIDDVRIYPRALTQAEITTLAQGNQLGIYVEGDITSSGGTFDFGKIGIGNSKTKNFSVWNKGGSDLNIDHIQISDEANWGFPTSPLSRSLIPGSTNGSEFAVLSVIFHPIIPGPKTATVTIFSDDRDKGEYTFNVMGNGIEPDLSCNASPLDVYTGSDVEFTASNINGTLYNWTLPDKGGGVFVDGEHAAMMTAKFSKPGVKAVKVSVDSVESDCNPTVNVHNRIVPGDVKEE
jgi:hypothetical protein